MGVRAADAHALQVELEQPTGYFLQLLQVSVFLPLPRHLIDRSGLDWTDPDVIVTNGPFLLESRTEDRIVLIRSPQYHGRIDGNVKQVEITLNRRGGSDLYQLCEDDQLDALFLFDLPPQAQDRSRQVRAGEDLTTPVLALMYVVFDVSRPPFDDLRLRKAFCHAIDRGRLAEVSMRGAYSPATGSMVPSRLPGHAPGMIPAFEPEAARRLLGEAGYKAASQFPDIECLCSSAYALDVISADLAAQWFANLGVKVDWQQMEWSSYLERLHRQLPHVWVSGWVADYPDDDSFLRQAMLDRSGGVWRDEQYVDLVDQARQSPSQGDRAKLFEAAQRLLAEQVPLMPLLYNRGELLLKPWVVEYPLSPMRWDFFKDVVIEGHN